MASKIEELRGRILNGDNEALDQLTNLVKEDNEAALEQLTNLVREGNEAALDQLTNLVKEDNEAALDQLTNLVREDNEAALEQLTNLVREGNKAAFDQLRQLVKEGFRPACDTLWQLINQRDSATWKRLREHVQGWLEGYFRNYKHSHHEDAVQLAMKRILEKHKKINDRCTFLGWAKTTATRVALTYIDKINRWSREGAMDGQELSAAVAGSSTPDEEAPHWLAHLEYCLERLDPREREVLKLQYWKNLGGEKLARHFSIGRDQVYQLGHRARNKLKTCLKRRMKERSDDRRN